jgi:hypothetical protein
MKSILLSIALTSFMLFSTNSFAQQRPEIGIFPGGGEVIVSCHHPLGFGDWTETVYTMAAANILVGLCNSEGGLAWVENRLR